MHYQAKSLPLTKTNLKRQRSTITSMFISSVAAHRDSDRVLFLTSSGFVYQAATIEADPVILFPLLSMKVLTIDCTATVCLAVANLRQSASKQGVIINNQLIDENRHIAYKWGGESAE